MKSKLFLLSLLAIVSFTTNAQVKQDRKVASFHSIDVGGAFNIFLRMGDKSAVTVIADAAIIEDISTVVDDGVLEIEMDSDWWDNNNDSKIDVYITVTNLKSLDLSGACNLQTKNTIHASVLALDLSGACKVEAEFECELIAIDASGASKITLSGTCSKLNVDASGASAIYAANLQSKMVNIDASGACKAEVNCSNSLNIDASGACSVRYKGSPKINKEVSGASKVTAM